MSTVAIKPRGAHLVGSVPLASADEVFRAAASGLGAHLKRIPDGETGERSIWIVWQGQFYAAHPAFEVEPKEDGDYAAKDRYRLIDPSAAAALEFTGGIGYADVAIESYRRFAQLKNEGVIRESTRFQVSLPTPLAPVAQFVSLRDQAAVEPAYTRQMLRELERICDAVPLDDLAIQWDVAIEMGMWERLGGMFEPWFDDVETAITERLARLVDAVPASVEVGMHLCYGDFGHQHFSQPSDARNLVAVTNAVVGAANRDLDWVHLPVPRDRSDEEYFSPLSGLQVGSGTELFLGLVHATDGAEGTQRRIEAAGRHRADFGVATECGFGRRPADTVERLLALHAQVSEPVA
jgi:hypothetical protein